MKEPKLENNPEEAISFNELKSLLLKSGANDYALEVILNELQGSETITISSIIDAISRALAWHEDSLKKNELDPNSSKAVLDLKIVQKRLRNRINGNLSEE